MGFSSSSDKGLDKTEDRKGGDDYWIIKADSEGNKLWDRTFGGSGNDRLSDIIALKDGSFLLGGFSDSYKSFDKSEKNSGQDYWIVNVDKTGNKRWDKSFGGLADDFLTVMRSAKDGGYLLGGFSDSYKSPDKSEHRRATDYSDYWIIKTYPEALDYNKLTGKIQTSGNKTLSNIPIEIQPGNYYGKTDANGNYTVYVGQNEYTAKIHYPYPRELVEEIPGAYDFQFTDWGQTQTKDFSIKTINKPLIKTDLGSGRRRRCFGGKTVVSYENVGFAAAANARLTVTYPEFVDPISAEPTWSERNGKTLIWDLGSIPEDGAGKIHIIDSVICGNEEIRGLTQCTEAVVSYDNRRLSEDPLWDKSDISLTAAEEEANLKMSIKNTGEGDMNQPRNYRVFINNELHTEGLFALASGQETSVEIAPSGKTVRLEADQSPFYPGDSRPALTKETVGINRLGSTPQNFFKGYVAQMPQDDADEFKEIDCAEIVDSYDPNDKTAYPEGVTESHYITDSDELEFRIRFQNTGTDTAYNIIVRDTLSEFLDVPSLRSGVSSHAYTYELSGDGKGRAVISWTFKNIYLPDNKIDEAGSHGFVKFKIRQKPSNPKGTEIKNQAHIYFDFNSAIITNETSRTVWELPLTEPKYRIDKDGKRSETGQNNSTIFQDIKVNICGTDFPTKAKSGEEISLCYNTENVILSGNLPETGNGSWSLIQGSAEIVKTEGTEIEAQNIGFGETVFEWTISFCDSVTKGQYRLNRKEKPLVNIDNEGDTLKSSAADSYQWFFNNLKIEGAVRRSFFAEENGNYSVEITKDGCTVHSEIFSHQITSTESGQFSPTFQVYPNPATNALTIQFSSNEKGDFQAEITDIAGHKIKALSFQKSKYDFRKTVSINDLPKGVYFLSLKFKKTVKVRKIVKSE